MSIIDYTWSNSERFTVSHEGSENRGDQTSSPTPEHGGRLHRIREVRQNQSLSIRSIARRTGMEPRALRHEEDPATNLTISDLYRWQKVLDVPIAELLEDHNEPISRPVLERARMLKLMKTVKAILERTAEEPIKRLSSMLVDQIVEIMPELATVGPWHSVGQRRTLDDIGRIGEITVNDDLADDWDDSL